ncbi:alpha/beta hydrolase family protein [Bradyrhizobium lupini]|uniref:alpha/beta hydrolase family protein n=1 Tax=Rhizobium lupini TaxID=136996 RepID=UPI00366F8B73
MDCATWPVVLGDLASTRCDAAAFLDGLQFVDVQSASHWQHWSTRWSKLGDAHSLQGDLNAEKGATEQAREAWLCALTAFEVARRLIDEDDPVAKQVSAKIEGGVQRLGSALEQNIERVQIAHWDQSEISAYYMPPSDREFCAPAVICVSREEERAETLLGRLLPLVVGRGISILVVSHDDVSNHARDLSNLFLSSCMDFLSVQPKVDAARVGVYGEGLSAVLATDFARSDSRVAAAVCDGGLWNRTRLLASIGWMTRTAGSDNHLVCTRRREMAWHLKCPVLVVAGGRGVVSVSEAIRLQNDWEGAQVDLEVTMPRMSAFPLREIENFPSSDDCVFRWLDRKLANSSQRPIQA